MAAVRKEQAKREGHILDEAEKTAKGILEIRDMFTGFNEKSNEIDAGIATLQGRMAQLEENDNV